MLPSPRAKHQDRSRQGPRRTIIQFRCPRCTENYDEQPYLYGGRPLRPGCPKCSYLGHLELVRVRE